ncbi:MAG: NAD+ synthase [Deltaproteobacteria bacterium]|nr:NAD+ synthase [Deltaproteobacteria bacterium]
MRIAIAQLNPTVGDLTANVDRLAAAVDDAGAQGAELVVAPELAVTGYPPKDLLENPAFVRDAVAAARRLVDQVRGPALLVGAVISPADDPLAVESRLANGALLIKDGAIRAAHRKLLLPTYDVFDESRYFVPGSTPSTAVLGDLKLGITVCEDIWNDKAYWQAPRYDRDPAAETAALGPDLIVNLSASPFERGKPEERAKMLQALARHHRRPVLYVNQIGGNDSLIFDGRSTAVDATGAITWRAPAYEETVAVATFAGGRLEGQVSPEYDSLEADVIDALCLGLSDYARKCGFTKVVLGLSGGIDSAITASLAARALGPAAVLGVAMPSRYSSPGSLADAEELARRLGIRLDVVPIEPLFAPFLTALAPAFQGLAADVTEENLQARIRGTLLMAYANKLGALLLTTGNKSEVAVGYATLYGDMCGGLAPLADLYKTQVYALARHLNDRAGAPIPEASITKPPSAELRPGQTDQDSLPPYAALDLILEAYIEGRADPAEMVRNGFDARLVARVVAMLHRAEYKRRQAAPGLRVSRKAFGEGRRLPIAQTYVPEP